MKAVYIQKTGGPATIIVGSLPVPKVRPKSVLIKVIAASINYVDLFIRSGIYQTDLPNPYILGRDAIGQVVEIGKDVIQFKVGDCVWTNSMGYDGRQGITSEYALIPEERLFLTPKNADSLKLIGAVHSAATATIVLQDIMELKPKQKLLIEGAAGHVGSKLVYLANEMGAEVVTTASLKDFSRLKQLSDAICFDYRDKSLFKKLKSAYPDGFDHIIDTSGEIPLQFNCDLLAPKGVISLITAPKDSQCY